MFNIEFCTSCCYDAVKVYDGADDSAPLLGLFCGDKLPDDLISSSNYLFVSFKSDAYTRKNGFRTTYKTKGKFLVDALAHVLVMLQVIIIMLSVAKRQRLVPSLDCCSPFISLL